MKFVTIVPLLLGVVIIVAAHVTGATALPFTNITPSTVTQLFGVLFTVALLLERSLEVFINVWREPQAAQLQLESQEAQAALDSAKALNLAIPANQSALTSATAKQSLALKALQSYRSQTQKIALGCSFVAGLTVSAVGLRTLETFLDVTAKGGLSVGHSVQLFAFHFVDIWLTGGLLAGGSEGIHKIMQAYTDFMEATSKKAKASAGAATVV